MNLINLYNYNIIEINKISNVRKLSGKKYPILLISLVLIITVEIL